MFNRELEGSKNQAENKTREYFALVIELECFNWELENAIEDIRKHICRVKTEQTSGKIIQRRLEAAEEAGISGSLAGGRLKCLTGSWKFKKPSRKQNKGIFRTGKGARVFCLEAGE